MIRQANKLDSYNIAKLIVSSWQTAYKGLIDDSFLNNMSVEIITKNWEINIESQNENNNIYVYEKENRILGIIRFGRPDDTTTNYNAEIHVLYVEPSLKRNGIGTKLFNFAKDYFISKNATNMIIWCLKTNLPSIKFYEKMGGKIVSTRKAVINNIELEEFGLEYNLQNNKVYLRNYMESDANEIIKWIKDEQSLRFWSADRYDDFPINANDINNNYKECVSCGNFYPMTLIDNNKVIGHIILRNPDLNNAQIVRLGFIIVDNNLRGKGYGKRLIEEALKYAQTNLKAKQITLGVFEKNKSAYHCYKSIGFKEIKVDKNVFKFGDENWNCIEMIL